MQTEPMTDNLVALTQLSKQGFLNYIERANALYQLLYGDQTCIPKQLQPVASTTRMAGDALVGTAANDASGADVPAPDGVRPRPPMRPPAAGSLREAVYLVLEREAGPATPKHIVQMVSAMRNMPATDNMRASIGEILRHPHDPRIRRVAVGLYTIEACI